MISIVCVYDDFEILENHLLRSLKKQSVKYEFIGIDNTRHHFQSAAEALNYGGGKSQGEFIMYAHQDVDLLRESWLEDAHKMLLDIPTFGIAGVAGARPGSSAGDRDIISNIENSIPPQRLGHLGLSFPEKVESVDECLMIVPRKIFEKFRFDNKTCTGWHLYGVDYCLSLSALCYDIYVLPMSIYHRSPSWMQLPPQYFEILKKIIKKHKKNYQRIITTCGVWYTRYPIFLQKFKYDRNYKSFQHWMRTSSRKFLDSGLS